MTIKELPVYGKSYNGTYFFKLREAKSNESYFEMLGTNCTIDVMIKTVPTQPRIIIGCSVAKLHTINYPDAMQIKESEWIEVKNELIQLL